MRLTNNQIALLAILFTIVSLAGNSMVYHRAGMLITGKAATGQLSICLNHPPVLELNCSIDAPVDSLYTCDVNASDPNSGVQELTFSDNTSLFNIGSADGTISFTPTVIQEGIYSIAILVEDNSSCSNSIDSGIITLNVSSDYYCGDGSCQSNENCSTCEADCGSCPSVSSCGDGNCDGDESCSSCPEDCGACSSDSGSSGGGGGGGGGISSQGFHVDFSKIDTKILRTGDKKTVKFTFDGISGFDISIIEVGSDYMTALLKHRSKTYTINMDEEIEIDINGDGTNDMSITLTKTWDMDVWLYFQRKEGADVLLDVVRNVIQVDPEMFKVSLKLGDNIKRRMVLSNMLTGDIDVEIETRGIGEVVRVDEKKFSLGGFENKIIDVVFDTRDTKVGTYNGEILVRAKGVEKKVLVIIEVESKKVIVDINTYIPSNLKVIRPGQDISSNIDLYNLEGIKADVDVVYQIKNSLGEVIVEMEEVINVDKDLWYTRELPIPRDIEEGRYVFVVMAKYGYSTSMDSDIFDVKGVELPSPLENSTILAIVIAVLILLGAVLGILVHRHPIDSGAWASKGNLRRDYSKEVAEKTSEEPGIRKKVDALEEGYRLGYISKGAYRKGKKEIERYMSK